MKRVYQLLVYIGFALHSAFVMAIEPEVIETYLKTKDFEFRFDKAQKYCKFLTTYIDVNNQFQPHRWSVKESWVPQNREHFEIGIQQDPYTGEDYCVFANPAVNKTGVTKITTLATILQETVWGTARTYHNRNDLVISLRSDHPTLKTLVNKYVSVHAVIPNMPVPNLDGSTELVISKIRVDHIKPFIREALSDKYVLGISQIPEFKEFSNECTKSFPVGVGGITFGHAGSVVLFRNGIPDHDARLNDLKIKNDVNGFLVCKIKASSQPYTALGACSSRNGWVDDYGVSYVPFLRWQQWKDCVKKFPDIY